MIVCLCPSDILRNPTRSKRKADMGGLFSLRSDLLYLRFVFSESLILGDWSFIGVPLFFGVCISVWIW